MEMDKTTYCIGRSKDSMIVSDGDTVYPVLSKSSFKSWKIELHDYSFDIVDFACQKNYKLYWPTTNEVRLIRALIAFWVSLGLAAIYVSIGFAFFFATALAFVGYQLGPTNGGLKKKFDLAQNQYNRFNESRLRDLAEEKRREDDYRKKSKARWLAFHRMRNIDHLDSVTGDEFERVVASLYRTLGYDASITKRTGDFGIDIIAEKDGIKLAIQTKRYSGAVGVQAVQEVVAGMRHYDSNQGVVVTNSSFTKPAISLAKTNNVLLVDRGKLSDMFVEAGFGDLPKFNLRNYEAIKEEIGAVLDKRPIGGKRKRGYYRRPPKKISWKV